MPNKFPAKMRLGVVHSNKPPYDWVELSIEDKTSGVIVAEVSIGIEDFGRLLAQQGIEGTVQLFDSLHLIGKTSETKTLEIEINGDDIPGSLAPYEVDGWKGSTRDAENTTHRTVKYLKDRRRIMTIGFHRYV